MDTLITNPKPTAYIKMQLHLERHKYRKGAYYGDTPADPSRRAKSNFRVTKRHDCMAVIFHNTYILRAYPDGRVMLDCGGWASHPTTKDAVNDALARFARHIPGRLHSTKYKGLNQLCLGSVAYYDGITFDSNGVQLSEPKPFMMRRINRDESADFRRGIKESGFKDMFKLLHATVPADLRPRYFDTRRLADKLTDPDRAVDWPEIVAYYKWAPNWEPAERDASACWQGIMAECKSRMYETAPSDVIRLI